MFRDGFFYEKQLTAYKFKCVVRRAAQWGGSGPGGAAMSFRWEVLADPTSDGQEVWTTMQFDEPSSQESIERAHSRGDNQNYTYEVSHPRWWGPLKRKYQVCFSTMTQELLLFC